MRSSRRLVARTAALVLGLCACPSNSPMTPNTEETGDSTSETGSSDVATTACTVGELGCACTAGGGCDPDLVCSDALICEPGQDPSQATETLETTADATSTTGSSGDMTTSVDDTSTSSETTAPPVDCGEEDLASFDADCTDPSQPFCGAGGVCVGCTADSQCSDASDDLKTACLDSGACAECDEVDAINNGQCSDKQPHCNLDELECEGCLEHSECPGTACDIAARTCFTTDRMLYVRRGPTNLNPCTYDVPTGGSSVLPYCDMQAAIDHAQFNAASSGWIFTMMASDSTDEHSAFEIPGVDTPVSYAIRHEEGTLLDKHTRFLDYGPIITVNSNVTLYLIDMGVDQRANAFADSHRGIDCTSGGAVWLDDSRVLRAVGPGIKAESCDIHLRRSSVAFGRTEGIDMTGGSLHLQNSFVDENGSKSGYGGGGLKLSGGAFADIVYSTLANNANESLSGHGDTIDCDGPTTINIHNSILGRHLDTGNVSVVCPGSVIEVDHSVVDGDFQNDQGNQKYAPEDILPLLTSDSLTGAYRVADPAKAMKLLKAIRMVGDPQDDFERQSRKPVKNDLDYSGADYYQSN